MRMPFFRYKARDAAGRPRGGRLEASDAAALSRHLRGEGWLVLAVEEESSPETDAGLPPRWNPAWLLPVASLDLELGMRQASSMLKSGVPLTLALQTVAAQARRPRAMRAWLSLLERVRSGESLSGAMAEQPRVFADEIVQLVRVGEHSGELDAVFGRAADQLAARREVRALVLNALLYPCLTILMAIGVSVFLVASVIPKIAAFLKTGNTTLPPLTQSLMDLSDWIRGNGAYVLAGIVLFAVLWTVVRLSPKGRESEDALLLRLPVSGKILRISGTAVFARVMAMLLESGVTLLDSLRVVGNVLGNRRLARRIADAREEVMRGEPLSAVLARAPEFLPMLARMTAVAETTGSLGESFHEVARFHETLLAITVKRLSATLEPVTILVTGSIVGFVYVSFFLALFSMANAV